MRRFSSSGCFRVLLVVGACGSLLTGDPAQAQKPGVSRKVPLKVKSGDAAYNQLLRDAARRTSQGQHSQALESYRRILLAYPDDLTATRGSADALVALGRREEAETFLRDYLDRKGYDEAIWRSLAEIHRAREQYDVFLSDLVEVLKGAPAGTPLPMSWALRSFEDLASEPATADKVEPAIRKLIAEKAREHPEIRILMADVLLRRNDSSGALAEVDEADRSSKAGGAILFQYGEELYGSGRSPLAEAAYVKAAEAATDVAFRTQAWSRVADVALEQKRYTTASSAYEAIAKASPGTPAGVEALLNLADIKQTHLRDYAGALAAYKALEGNPNLGARQATLYLQTADCHLRMDQPDEAISVLNKLKAAPADQEIQAEGEFLMAEIKFFKGDFTGAQAAYQSLAENFTRTRKTNDAVGRYLQIARAIDSKETDALKLYATMEKYTRMSDTTTVLDTSRKLQADFAASDLAADALVREAEMIRNRGKAREAVTLCERAVAEHPKARIAAYALAVMGDIYLSELSDKKLALAAFERLLDEYPENLLAAEVRRTLEKLRRNSES
jgi:tetratricopeptide (TPR) repeat protein